MHRLLALVAITFSIFVTSPVSAQEKSAAKEGFAFPSDGSATILVFRPDISVGEQSAGGLNEPNVEWTETARTLLTEELTKADVTSQHRFVFLPDYEGDDGKLVSDYRNLFKAVTGSVLTHKLFVGNRLPTKKKVDSLEYNMGNGTQKLAELGGGQYGLFFCTYDSYGSAGRKAAQAVGMLGCLIGACVIVPSGVHIGYAGLVDLETGDLVWVNADGSMGGDVRELEGAQKRVAQLLEDFPLPAEGTVGGAVIKTAVTEQAETEEATQEDAGITGEPDEKVEAAVEETIESEPVEPVVEPVSSEPASTPTD
ncbi:hypothetical protein SAMN02745824_2378 [Parasphingorhabdus marina DSM 22363]|uniref:Uncharacterized protein n=1 Tax=Parasphingorhabdus marina DSM 22363 TaxID=1123272 RepID=A0A1N6FG29_9SPHN|nr:hypothetical protein [Parasphingorhabdus marina]SIN94194.1 hypothetical protein SAMN02745824_2378 [Parasphingorhabdus marina DSM 22363]